MNDDPPVIVDDAWSLSKPSSRRSLTLCAIGAIVGLAIAGLGLFTAKGTRTSVVPPEDVALVNQVPILMSDYLLQLRALYDLPLSQATAAQKKKVLDDMIREELYVQRGIELGLQSDTVEVRTALVGAVEAQSEADARMAQPSEAELRDYYQKRRDADFASEGTMELADYMLPRNATPVAIQMAVAALRAGNTTAAQRSGKMMDGEEFYFAARVHLGDRLFAAARALPSGAVSAPVTTADGVHILVMKRNLAPEAEPFEQIRDRVLKAYVDTQAKILTAANERFVRKRADIQLARGFE